MTLFFNSCISAVTRHLYYLVPLMDSPLSQTFSQWEGGWKLGRGGHLFHLTVRHWSSWKPVDVMVIWRHTIVPGRRIIWRRHADDFVDFYRSTLGILPQPRTRGRKNFMPPKCHAAWCMLSGGTKRRSIGAVNVSILGVKGNFEAHSIQINHRWVKWVP